MAIIPQSITDSRKGGSKALQSGPQTPLPRVYHTTWVGGNDQGHQIHQLVNSKVMEKSLHLTAILFKKLLPKVRVIK